VITKYNLMSVSLEKFFVGPLPDFAIAASSGHCMPTSARLPAVNGCLSAIDLCAGTATDNTRTDKRGGGVVVTTVNDAGVIDLTEDDVDVVPVSKTSSSATSVVKKKPARSKSDVGSAQKNNHRNLQGQSDCAERGNVNWGI